MEENVFIKLEHISKTFPGVKALDNISLTIKHGEVHALVGENGAGKSTLIKVLAGNYKPDEGGRIMIDGETFDSLTPRLSLHKGIVVIYQDFSLFPNLSVAENISITEEMEKKGVCVNWNEMRTIAQKALERLGVDIDVNVQLGTLSTAKQQLVAIARALACDAKLIIMDEPTSTLSSGEVELLFKIIRELKRQNISVLFVSHKLEELFEIADMFTVIRDGQYIDARPRDQMDNDTLISLMVGRKVEFVHQGADKLGDVVLEVRHLSRYGNFKDVSFTVRKGEIVSLSGLVGAGRTEVVQAICGLEPADSGEILIHGKTVTIKNMKDAVAHRIAYVPESRLTEGLVLTKSVEDNSVMTVHDRLRSGHGLVSLNTKHKLAKDWIEKLNIKPGYPDMVVQKLSGGNQQRVVIAKWLATDPEILFIDEPTNGIDIGAKSEIHNLMRRLASQGMAIVMVSSELPEVLSISDTVLVMRRGRINGVFDGAATNQEELLNAAILSNPGKGANP